MFILFAFIVDYFLANYSAFYLAKLNKNNIMRKLFVCFFAKKLCFGVNFLNTTTKNVRKCFISDSGIWI